MIDPRLLLADLKRLRRRLEEDLRQHHASSAGRAAAEAEWREARDTRRTADTFETFFSAALDQAAVHWILALVFLRFLEDNGLLDRPIVAGAGEAVELAQLRQREHFRRRPTDSDAEYLLAAFADVAHLPGLAGLFDTARNPLFQLPVSGDGAAALFAFFRTRAPGKVVPAHDFAEPSWNTRFLGDLYQDLSEDARKRYALLQTPDFVEEWILSRTLDPAIAEFGYEAVRMIDPACGSGHFLLGGFDRLLAQWQRHAPELPPAAQAQHALRAVSGVDLNPFAAEIARFRLLVAALRVSGITRLAAAPDFRIHVAVGDSLLHGRHFGPQQDFGGEASGFQRTLRHHYAAEDTLEVDAILGRQYHAVLGNPPYITPKDAAMRKAYRGIYASCYMKYALAAPFTERFFDLARPEREGERAGFVGLIVANSFMKREFGRKLIQDVLPKLDVTHVVDCSGAYIPGNGTPSAILFGRNRAPVQSVVRTVRGIRGEPATPDDPALGLVWSAIVAQTDIQGSTSNFVSVEDTAREALACHPWNMGGGGAAELQEKIEGDWPLLQDLRPEIGFGCIISEEEAFDVGERRDLNLRAISTRCVIIGENVRDWAANSAGLILFPYDGDIRHAISFETERALWPWKNLLLARRDFGNLTYREVGRSFTEYHQIPAERNRIPLTITFGEVATHNHFVLDRGGKVFKQTAPVMKLPAGASEDDHLGLVGLLNSSTACFWLKQVCYPKGGDYVGNEGARVQRTKWDERYSFNGSNVERFPLAAELPLDLARALDAAAQHLTDALPASIAARATPTRENLDAARAEAGATRARMIALQEELDWSCYRLYGLLHDAQEHPDLPRLQLGERAFEIVMARHMEAGELETAWFERHGSTPITELPEHWPEDYRATVEHRIALIGNDSDIGLIERPEYKRRWSTAPWEEMERDALRVWLLDRLEDVQVWDAGEPRIISARALADIVRGNQDFRSVAVLYAGIEAPDLDNLLATLATAEAVPFLATLRYTEAGLRKRADWEATWEKQREEDAIDAASATPAEAKRRRQQEVGDIPVPPKYKTPDFQSVGFWRLRGGLDVPKERFVSFPHLAPDADASPLLLWAGYDHLARARALAALYVERRETDGWAASRLTPILAGLLELIPWLKQWQNDIDQETGLRMGDFFAGYVQDQTRELGLTEGDLRGWTPPAIGRRGRARRATL